MEKKWLDKKWKILVLLPQVLPLPLCKFLKVRDTFCHFFPLPFLKITGWNGQSRKKCPPHAQSHYRNKEVSQFIINLTLTKRFPYLLYWVLTKGLMTIDRLYEAIKTKSSIVCISEFRIKSTGSVKQQNLDVWQFVNLATHG